MEGERKKSGSGETEENPIKTEAVDTGGPPGAEAADAAEVPGPAAGRMVVLDALLAELEAPLDRWPGEALKAVLERFVRMPRGGWQHCHSKFCVSFGCSISLDEFTKRAKLAITSSSGRKCS